MDKKEFLTKLILFITFSIIAPIVYLSIRFSLFTSKTSLSLWGVFVLMILCSMIIIMLKYYLSGMKTKWSIAKQIINGFLKIIMPLVIILILAIWFKAKYTWLLSNIDAFIEVMCVIIGCEIFAVLINPLDKWAFENNVDGLVEIVDKIIKKEK